MKNETRCIDCQYLINSKRCIIYFIDGPQDYPGKHSFCNRWKKREKKLANHKESE